MMTRIAALLPLALISGCFSLARVKKIEKIVWDDGKTSHVEIWHRLGANPIPPWFVLADVAATPLMAISESVFAWRALHNSGVRIAGGPAGYVASLLPVLTCAAVGNHPSRLIDFDQPLPADSRREFEQLDGSDALTWLADRSTPSRRKVLRAWAVSADPVIAVEPITKPDLP